MGSNEYDGNFFAELNSVGIPNSLNIYPNPATDELHISLSSNHSADVTITDLNGRSVLSSLINESGNIVVESLAPGNYIILVHNKDTGVVTKEALIIN